jgi:cellulose biosynthesis protein BcsQ
MKVFACYNIKGGVGKTATTVNLAYLASQEGARTLIWDLDPQGAASFYLRIKPKIKGGTKALVKQKKEMDEFIKGSDYENLDLLPADFSYRNMDLILEDSKKPLRRLRKILKPLADEYDLLFLDCPPSISLVSENVFNAAHALLIPTIPTVLSLRTLQQIEDFFAKEHLNLNRLMPFFSMVDMRKSLHKDIVENPPQGQVPFLQNYIPYASEVEQMGLHRAAVSAYAGKSRSAAAYEQLWQEIKSRVQL